MNTNQFESLGKATEVFVTGAYKKRLEERRLWEIEEKERAEREAKNDVKKKGNLSGFYTGMIGVLANAPVAVDFDEKLGKKEGKSHKRQLQSANETGMCFSNRMPKLILTLKQ